MIFLGGSIDQSASFQLILYYPSQGIFAMYVTDLEPAENQEKVKICFTQVEYADLFLWDTNKSFSETKDYIFKQYEHPFYDIETITDLKISDFYERFTNSDQPDCFQTQSKLWSR